MTYEPPTPSELRKLHSERALDWHDYADAWLRFRPGRLLDFGCGPGAFLRRIAGRCEEAWGVDVDPEAVAAAATAVDGRVRRVPAGHTLPFPSDFFDTVVSLEVVEHVADERAMLGELSRVLRPGGRLLITTPHRGLLTFFDPGNFKFVAPRLHRFFHKNVLRSRRYYDDRFGDARRRGQGMVADFTLDQVPWHRHYRFGELCRLAPAELRPTAWAVYYPGFRAFSALRLAVKVVSRGRIEEHLRPACWARRQLSRCRTLLGDQLVVLFEKRRD